MLKRASWILRTGFILCVLTSMAWAENITIKFTDLDALAQEKTPLAKIIEAEHARALAERDEDF